MRHRGREEWRRLLVEGRGETATELARRLGVHPLTVYRWRRTLDQRAREPRSGALARIVELRPARLSADDRFEVRLDSGRRVGVPPSFDEAALERLLRVLEATS